MCVCVCVYLYNTENTRNFRLISNKIFSTISSLAARDFDLVIIFFVCVK